MSIKPEHVIAFGALVVAGLAQVTLKPKAKKRIVISLLVVIAVIAVGVSFFRDKASPNITTHGKNSPAGIQTVTASGGSTVNQAGRDININYRVDPPHP